MNKKLCGIVEGFFSSPVKRWTSAQRLATVQFFIRDYPGFNTYLYCPKDDPYVKKWWNLLYPKKKLKDLLEIARLCKKNNITFVYGLNPAFSLQKIQRDFDTHLKKIEVKITQLASIGVNTFCILYDDIPFAYSVLSGEQDKNELAIGQMQARVMNKLIASYNETGMTFWFCPTDYFFTRKTPYLKGLMDALNPAIPLLWTGESVFVKKVTKSMLSRAQKVAGPERTIIWWDNYPVNDCEHTVGTFHIGAFNAPDKSARQGLGGILINPMREAYANFIAYDTFHQYLKNPTVYSRAHAVKKSFERYFPEKPTAYLRVYTAFSDRNIVDTNAQSYIQNILHTKKDTRVAEFLRRMKADISFLKKTKSRSRQALLFLKSTQTLIRKAENRHSLYEAIMQNKKWHRHFRELDKLPVVMEKRYWNKLYRVMDQRLRYTHGLHKDTIDRAHINARDYASFRKIASFYRTANKLTVPTPAWIRFRTLLKKLIIEEQKCFLSAIDKQSPLEKVKRTIERSLLNGY